MAFAQFRTGQLVWLEGWNALGEPDENTGFRPRVPATLASVTPDAAVVEPDWGETCSQCAVIPRFAAKFRPKRITISASGPYRIFPMDSSNEQTRADMLELADLNVGELMFNLRRRFKSQPMQFYTYVGDILIAVNPMMNTDSTSDTYKRMFVDAPDLRAAALPPHVYATAERAYQALRASAAPQVIVISGESGSGKTFATNDVVNYLAFRSQTLAGGARVDEGVPVSARVAYVPGFLEPLGNAKTSRNHNSSRFGKLLKIQFDARGLIEGASMQTYLLEKSRVVDQADGERNYHIFYLMLANLAPGERSSRHLTVVEDYAYLINSRGSNRLTYKLKPFDLRAPPALTEPMEDAARWADFVASVAALQLTDVLPVLWNVLAAILHLGNLSFAEDGADGSGLCTVRPAETLNWIADLLAVDGAALRSCLLSTQVVGTRRAYRPDKAKQTADALAKALYARLFDALVARINSRTCAAEPSRTWIGVLDIFGFESFQEAPDKKGIVSSSNKLEQLCINLTNERLQKFFLNELIPKQLARYEQHGLNVADIVYDDNTECVDLIMEDKHSLVRMLNAATREAASLPAFREKPKLAERRWVESIKSAFKSSRNNTRPVRVRRSEAAQFIGWFDDPLDDRANESFCVHHYADLVWYSVDGCIDKNADRLAAELASVVCGSRDALVCSLFADAGQAQAQAQAQLDTTVIDKFAEQLRNLVSPVSWGVPGHAGGVLDQAEHPLFVRCVKPICQRVPGMPAAPFENHKVLDQLNAAGMYAVIQMRLAGYASEVHKADFVEQYIELVTDLMAFRALSLDDQVRHICETVVDGHAAELTGESRMAPYQIGTRDLVFLKDSMVHALQDALALARNRKLERKQAAAGHCKALLRMWMAVRQLPAMREAYEAARERLDFIAARMAEGASHADAVRAYEDSLAERARETERLYKAAHWAPHAQRLQDLPIDVLVHNIDAFLPGESDRAACAELAARRQALVSGADAARAALEALEKQLHEPRLEAALVDALDALAALAASERESFGRDEERRRREDEARAERTFRAQHLDPLEALAAKLPIASALAGLDDMQASHASVLAQRPDFREPLQARREAIEAGAAAVRVALDGFAGDVHNRAREREAHAQLETLDALLRAHELFLRNTVREIKVAELTLQLEESHRERVLEKQAAVERRRAEVKRQELALAREKEREKERQRERQREVEERKRQAERKRDLRRQRRLKYCEYASQAIDGTRVLFHDMECVVRFVGPLPDARVDALTGPLYLGLETCEPSELFNCGEYEGTTLFACPDQQGLFVAPSLVYVIVGEDEMRRGERALQLDDHVWRRNSSPLQTGFIRYLGETNFQPGTAAGIELDQKGAGDTNGRVNGFRYFRCERHGGTFVPPRELVRIEAWSDKWMDKRTRAYMLANGIELDDEIDAMPDSVEFEKQARALLAAQEDEHSDNGTAEAPPRGTPRAARSPGKTNLSSPQLLQLPSSSGRRRA